MREYIVFLLLLALPLVLRKGYKVAKKTNQLPEYWAWFGGFMIICTMTLTVIIYAELNRK